MRTGFVVIALAGACALAACSGSKTACYALSDEDAVTKVIAAYGKQPASTKGDPAQMQLTPARVSGIGRSTGAKGDGKALTQVWFSQDDTTLTVATLTEACDLQFRPGLAADAIQQAAIPVHKPNF
ncbi:MAG: hypothetical protein JWO72_3144 [Caulobacteraceae bacterium]|nr:hypothetical protein [Caulobacteraceae bacterium]